MRYFINKSFLTEMRIVMFVIVKGGIIYFKIFNDQKLWEMVRYFGGYISTKRIKVESFSKNVVN